MRRSRRHSSHRLKRYCEGMVPQSREARSTPASPDILRTPPVHHRSSLLPCSRRGSSPINWLKNFVSKSAATCRPCRLSPVRPLVPRKFVAQLPGPTGGHPETLVSNLRFACPRRRLRDRRPPGRKASTSRRLPANETANPHWVLLGCGGPLGAAPRRAPWVCSCLASRGLRRIAPADHPRSDGATFP